MGLAANVNIRSLTSSKGFFDLFFTAQVWELLVAQTYLYANQKRGAAEKSAEFKKRSVADSVASSRLSKQVLSFTICSIK